MTERIWTSKDQRLMQMAIGAELIRRLAPTGRQWTDLPADELRQARYQISLDFTTGKTAGEARAKVANLYRLLDVGKVPMLAQTVPHRTPDLEPEPDPPAPTTPPGGIDHPGMTPQWFDQAVHRAHLAGCRVIESGQPGVLFVTSGTVAGRTYRVTRTACSCTGHDTTGHCLHRALGIAFADVFRAVETGAARQAAVA